MCYTCQDMPCQGDLQRHQIPWSAETCEYPVPRVVFDPEELFTQPMVIEDLLTPYKYDGDCYTHLYWSSESSTEQQTTDLLELELVHPVCLVKEVQIEPYIDEPEASPSPCPCPRMCAK